jgi:rSAM/selenodomain-associated transferase 1
VFSTTPPPPRRLLIFARVPELGAVKTRLARDIGEERALAVYEAMLHDALSAIGTTTEDTVVEVMWAPTRAASAATLARAFGERELAMQSGTTLGDRLSMAFSERFFFHRTQAIIAVGVDEPRLTRAAIDHAFSLLDSVEWIVGPARDGGYYLIGCRAAAFDSSIFIDMPWGTSDVLPTTLARIRERQQAFALLPARNDIDVVEDLEKYAAENNQGQLAQLLARNGAAASAGEGQETPG